MNHHIELLSVIQQAFAKVQHKIDARRNNFLAWLIIALCTARTVNYQRLSLQMGTEAKTQSNYRRIQRFMDSACLSMMVVAQMIYQCLGITSSKLVLIMDRTNWKFGEQNINILMLAIKHRGIAYPLIFKLLNKRGNSNTNERIALIDDYIKWFGRDSIEHILADREFVGKHWIAYLEQQQIPYVIRIRNNFKISKNGTRLFCVSQLLWGLSKGGRYHSQRKLYVSDNWCYVSVYHQVDNQGHCDTVILISNIKNTYQNNRLELYQSRWQIECLFKALKSSGFHLEETHVKDLQRLQMLISVCLLAFVWCYRIGEYIHEHIEPIVIKKHGRQAESVFRYGLDKLTRYLFSGFKPKEIINMDFFRWFLSCT